LNGMEKIGDSLFALYSNKIYEIGLTDNTTSPDTWTSVNTNSNGFGPNNGIIGVAYGNNTFVAVGDSGNIVRSTDDGSSWENATSPTANGLYGVTFGNNTFVGVGLSGYIIRSTDNGSSWNNSTSPITTDLNGVTFSE